MINMVTLPLRASHKEQRSGFAQMPFTLRCVQYMVTSVLQDQQYRFSVV